MRTSWTSADQNFPHLVDLQRFFEFYWIFLDVNMTDALSASRSSKKAPFGRFFVGDALIKREKDRNTRM